MFKHVLDLLVGQDGGLLLWTPSEAPPWDGGRIGCRQDGDGFGRAGTDVGVEAGWRLMASNVVV